MDSCNEPRSNELHRAGESEVLQIEHVSHPSLDEVDAPIGDSIVDDRLDASSVREGVHRVVSEKVLQL